MTIHRLFPTLVYASALQARGAKEFNRQLLKECRQLRHDDDAGRRWSAKNYPGGYTSYGSVHWLQRISPTFKALESKLQRHVAVFADAVQWDLEGRKLSMTDCWINMMPKNVVHGLHLHPLSTVSGTYYVHVPAGTPGIKFEDPRLDRFMAAPPRRVASSRAMRPWGTFPAVAGQLLLFESWLRHEVVPNRANAERVSISFNYHWC
ncbi:MAG TPA: TIGR02466 family protein [Steroidobacteraceae bacterium]|nr:TIGR02466 family protein [Steroidobacteraceae bacterium]